MSKPSYSRLGVISPMANEEKTINSFIIEVLKSLRPVDYLFIIVDNKSQDQTRDIVSAFSKKDQRVRLVWAPENRCIVDAYFRGYREALNEGCDWILEMDGGFSHNPNEIPFFLEQIGLGVDFLAGSRFSSGGAHTGSLKRYFISRIGSILSNLLLGSKMNDMTSGFQCFSRAALEHVMEQNVMSQAHFFQTEIRFMLKDWRWREIPITYTNPNKNMAVGNIKEALYLLLLLFASRRLKISGVENWIKQKRTALLQR